MKSSLFWLHCTLTCGIFGLMTYKQTCSNCKASEHCGQVGSPLPKTSLAGCEQQCLETADCQMPEYTTGILQPCKLYNCTQLDERDGSTVIRNTKISDCLLYTVSEKRTRKGICFSLESHAYAIDMSYCFELCLNRLGCRGATFWTNNTCTLHSCNDTDYEKDTIVMERLCVDCNYPPAPSNGTVELMLKDITTYPGAVATQACNEGYVLTGNNTIVCRANGLWSKSISCIKNAGKCVKSPVENCYSSSCKAHEICGQHLQRLTGFAKEDCVDKCVLDEVCQLVEYTASAFLYAVCTTVQQPQTPQILRLSCSCAAQLSNCKFVDCGIPHAPSKGKVALAANGVTTYGAKAIQSCDDGFTLNGEPTLQCQASGTWTESASCLKIETQCKRALTNKCTDCQAALSCGNYLTILTGDSKAECEKKCNQTNNCYLMEYTDGRFSECKLYNCSEVEYNKGSDAIIYHCSSGENISTRLATAYTRTTSSTLTTSGNKTTNTESTGKGLSRLLVASAATPKPATESSTTDVKAKNLPKTNIVMQFIKEMSPAIYSTTITAMIKPISDTRTANLQQTSSVVVQDYRRSTSAVSYITLTSTNVTRNGYFANKTSFFGAHLNIVMMSLIIVICGLAIFAVTTYLQLCHGRRRAICLRRLVLTARREEVE